MFNTDFKKLFVWLMPYNLRPTRYMLYLKACTWPIRQLYNKFLEFLRACIYRLTHNGQVCYLEKVMNDHFDVVDKRIWIGNFDGLERIYFWPEADQRDVDFSEVQFFWPDAMYADSGVDFVVHVPYTVATTPAQIIYMKSLLDEYKLVGKKYLIERF